MVVSPVINLASLPIVAITLSVTPAPTGRQRFTTMHLQLATNLAGSCTSGSGLNGCECSQQRECCPLSGLTDVSTRIITALRLYGTRSDTSIYCDNSRSGSPVPLGLLVAVAFALAPVALAFTTPIALPGSPVTLALAPVTLPVATPVALAVPGALALAATLAVAPPVALSLALPSDSGHLKVLHGMKQLGCQSNSRAQARC